MLCCSSYQTKLNTVRVDVVVSWRLDIDPILTASEARVQPKLIDEHCPPDNNTAAQQLLVVTVDLFRISMYYFSNIN